MNALNWFEIPVVDMKRAVGFYEATLDKKLRPGNGAGAPHFVIPYDDAGGAGVGGSLILDDKRKPSGTGTIVYLAADDVEKAAGRAKKAGGTVIADKIDIGPEGFIALLIDSEGNQIGLHQPRPSPQGT